MKQIREFFYTFRQVLHIAAQINRPLLITVIVINAFWGFSSLPGFYLQKLALDEIIKNIGNPLWQDSLYFILTLVGLRLLLEFVRNILSGVSNLLRDIYSGALDHYFERTVAQKLSELDIATIESPEFKDKFQKIEREGRRRVWGLLAPVSDIPNYLVGFVSSVAALVLLSPVLAISVIFASIPEFLFSSKIVKKQYDLRSRLSTIYKSIGWLTYYLIRNRNFMEMKLLNLAPYLSEKLKGYQDFTHKEEIEFGKQREKLRAFTIVPFSLLEIGASLWLIIQTLTQKISVGSFQFYISALTNAESNLTALAHSVVSVYENYIYVKDVMWFINLEPSIDSTQKGIIPDGGFKSITFEKVWFRYKKDQKWIIKDMSFTLHVGEKIAIVGENGAGKSTLIKLISRFYDPQRGTILVNDLLLTDIDISWWRKTLAVLYQEFEGYPFSAKESIGFGDPEHLNDIEGIVSAARKTQMDSYIQTLPKKYDTPLSPEFTDGVNLSAGQWQRIGIARMLFRKSSNLIIMDEPTSNVDPEAEENIFKQLSIAARNKALIFVTQRFSTVRIADRILVVENGKIIEQGTHSELMKLNAKYARLFTLQAQSYLNHTS